jgi:hypothetical protein
MIRVINGSNDPYFNLACEEWLMQCADGDVFMLWQNAPSVILGQNQNAFSEVNIPYDMDISPLVLAGGSVAYGVAATGENEVNPLQQVISSYFAGNGGIQDIAVTAISEMPIIPIGYRTGVLFCSEKIELNNKASASDIFFGFEGLNLK